MHLNIYMKDSTGHTSIKVEDGALILEWENTTLKEREELMKLVKDAMAKGYKPMEFNDQDIADEELEDGPSKTYFKRKGKLLFKGDNVKGLRVVCADLLDFELKKAGKLAFELQPDGSWEIITQKEVQSVVKEDSSAEKPQAIKTGKAARGG